MITTGHAPSAADSAKQTPSRQRFIQASDDRTGPPYPNPTYPVDDPSAMPATPAMAAVPAFPPLPAPVTSLVGREKEIAEVKRLLLQQEPAVRLLTLTGPGGVGKTRLALQVAAEFDAARSFPDGVCFLSMAPLRDPEQFVTLMARCLSVRANSDTPLLEQIAAHLRDRSLLLLLDNFEQLVDAGALLGELLTQCPALKALVTSRAVLHVYGEYEFSVTPLAVPDPWLQLDSQELSSSPAVALFAERARATRPDFALTPQNAAAVAGICARLDGLPLAIELAAARVRVLPPADILARLDHRLQLLTSGAANLPPRHRTLRSALEWSYDLLSPGERLLFRRLSVFVGGCSLDAVEKVCAGDATATSPMWDGDLLDTLSSLVDKSLLLRVDGDGSETGPRFRMLYTVREFAAEQLGAGGEEVGMGRAHARYFTRLAEASDRGRWEGSEQGRWMDILDLEQFNMQAALDWCLQSEEAEDVNTGLALAVALAWYWELRGQSSQAEPLERLLAQSSDVQCNYSYERGVALLTSGRLALDKGELDLAETRYVEALAVWRALLEQADPARRPAQATAAHESDAPGWVDTGAGLSTAQARLTQALIGLGHVAEDRDDYRLACAYYQEALRIRQEMGERPLIAHALSCLGCALRGMGDYEGAESALEQSVALFRELGDRMYLGVALGYYGEAARRHGQLDKARPLLYESLLRCAEVGYKPPFAASLLSIGLILLRTGHLVEARPVLEHALALAVQVGNKLAEAYSMIACAEATCLQPDEPSRGGEAGGAEVMVGMAEMEDLRRAVRLFAAGHALLDRLGVPFVADDARRHEKAMAYARTCLGEEGYKLAWAQGRTMQPDSYIAETTHMELAQLADATLVMLAGLDSKQDATEIRETAHRPGAQAEGLTERELDVLRLVTSGLSDVQIADELVVSPRTVHSHLRSIYTKLDVTSRHEAAEYAREHRLL